MGRKPAKERTKKERKKKEAVKAVYKHFLSHACDTTHVAPLNDPLPTPSTPPSATESGTRHNVIRTVEAMLQPTRGDGDRPKHQTWREWDGGWRAHTVERGLCGEGGERGGRELRHDVDVAGVAKQQLEGGLHVAARGDQSPHAGRVVAQPHVAKLLQLALICDSGVHQVGRQASSR